MLSLLGLLGAVLDLVVSFLGFRVGVKRPADNRDGHLDLVVSAIVQRELRQQIVIYHEG